MVRLFGICGVLLAAFALCAQTAEEKDAIAVAQKAFDGIAAHDATMLRGVMLPDAHIYSISDDATTTGTPVADLANRIASTQGELKESFTGKPVVSIHGRIAQVSGEYEFLRGGKFSHCGVDSFSLLKTAEGWKIATIVYTVETTSCKGR